jgi:hypothetical protein
MARQLGDAQDFAVEFALRSDVPYDQRSWLYGTMCFWAGGHRIGNHDEVTALTVVRVALTLMLQRAGTLANKHLLDLPAADAFLEIDAALYGDQDHLTFAETTALADKYDRYTALPASEVFDRWAAYIVEGTAFDRILVRDPDGSLIEARPRAGSFHRVLQQFLSELDSIATDWKRR